MLHFALYDDATYEYTVFIHVYTQFMLMITCRKQTSRRNVKKNSALEIFDKMYEVVLSSLTKKNTSTCLKNKIYLQQKIFFFFIICSSFMLFHTLYRD